LYERSPPTFWLPSSSFVLLVAFALGIVQVFASRA
jgi:hypothetical protein